MYSYKPAVYLVLALLYHMKTKRLGATWLFIHAGTVMLINQYDTNAGAKRVSPEKWEEYQQATHNYQTALSMINVSVWGYATKIMKEKFTTQDYLKVLQLRPH